MLENITYYWPITLPLLHTYCTHTDIIILDGVGLSHGEIIPLHFPSFSAFIRPLDNINDFFVLFRLFLTK